LSSAMSCPNPMLAKSCDVNFAPRRIERICF
jgi:hypothetical protein